MTPSPTYVRDGMGILEVGCGNGITVIELGRRRKVGILGIDFAAEMIAAAGSMLAGPNIRGTAKFQVGDVPDLSKRLQWKRRARMRLTIDWVIWIVHGEGATTIASKLAVFLPATDAGRRREQDWAPLVSKVQR